MLSIHATIVMKYVAQSSVFIVMLCACCSLFHAKSTLVNLISQMTLPPVLCSFVHSRMFVCKA